MNDKNCRDIKTAEPYSMTSGTFSVPMNFEADPISIEIENETFGAVRSPKYISTGASSLPISNAWRVLYSLVDRSLAASTEKVMLDIQRVVDVYRGWGFDLAKMPALHAVNVDNDSVLLEWATDTFRVGLAVDSEPEDSGWYFVSTKALGEIAISGSINETDSPQLVPWLVSLVVDNS